MFFKDLKYIFYILICLPVLFVGVHLFISLKKIDYKFTQQEEEQRQQNVKKQLVRKKFEIDYYNTHGDSHK